jgi:hypothetical protein
MYAFLDTDEVVSVDHVRDPIRLKGSVREL